MRYTIQLRLDKYGDMSLTGFLDMLRYDGAKVISWEPDSDDRGTFYRITLEGNCTEARWHSMGFYPMNLGYHPVPR